MHSHLHVSDLHGLSRLAVEGVLGTTDLVEQMHYAIARVSGPTLRSADGRTRGITGLVYRSIHGITGLVGRGADFAFGQVVPRLPAATSTPRRDRALAVLNGVLGDHLLATDNPLALAMTLRHGGRILPVDASDLAAQLPRRRRRIAVFLHGLCMSDHHWAPAEAEGEAANLPQWVDSRAGYLPLQLMYNTGLPISANGKALAGLLESMVRHWSDPIDELVLIGHSMGGLVARSACCHGAAAGHTWMEPTGRLITLGSPHLGAPLEAIGHKVDQALALTPFTAPFTRLARIRSAGITNLRDGRVTDHPRQTFPEHVRHYAIAATLASDPDSPRSRTVGDGLVTVNSALGRHDDPGRGLRPHRQWIATSTGHLQLLHHPGAAGRVLEWLSES